MSETPVEISPPQSQPSTDWSTAAPTVLNLGICLGLILSIFSVYAQVRHFDFVDLDDMAYVAGNAHVEQGLTADSVKWAFTNIASGNWIPVTLLTHVLDGQLFGMRSGMHHLMNVFYHMLAAMLLFAVLMRATGARWPSAFVAFVFALHPLHVESVAWVAERKDVLSACFFFLALLCYVRYTEKPSVSRYVPILVALALGLMSKPMLVTFPCVVLLLDVWPLRRIAWPRMLWEKLPLFALSAGSSVVTYFVQRSAGAFSETALTTRVENALISYGTYIKQTFWPDRLVVFYTYPDSIPVWQAVASLVIIAGVSALVIRAWRTRPYLAVGWFWYLGTLVPVIGLVQAGQQAHADRYTYLPMIGLLMMLAWGAVDLIEKWPRTETVVAVAAAACCFACLVLASKQTAYWQNSETLFRRAIDASENNWATESNLGVYLSKIPARRGEAAEHFEAALRIKPDYPQAHSNLGWCLAAAGLYGPAIAHYQEALRLSPDLAETNENMGRALLNSGREVESIPYFEKAVSAKPTDANKRFGLALALTKIPGRIPEAISQYEAILRMSPDDQATHYNLGLLFESLGRIDEAIAQLETSQRIHAYADVGEALDRVRGKKEKQH